MPIDDYCEKPAVTVLGSETVRVAAQRMKSAGLGSLVVVGDGRPTGIVTDRDLVIGTLCNRLDPGCVRVDEIASRPLVTIEQERSVAEAVRVIRYHAVRRIPVVDEKGELIGIVAADDLISMAASQLSGLSAAIRAQRPRDELEGRRTQC